ncbi:B12-binding domain-containing radical SAM protein [Actinomadura latina]|uniref:B12-binding domain-containing radical SAM protein n=1 Tax=Actinomadura latina TaxID=163603 RepID=A0A846Z488_9ACTN|nr:radical SAM protein [Actinomadura latina]NKZ05485.1 B12-binding domain-containing radical SAM protein [Actinomadura latina]
MQDRALLISPAYDASVYTSAESLGLRSVAAALAVEGADVRIVEQCPPEAPSPVNEWAWGARLIGIGVLFTRQIPAALELTASLRSVAPAAHIVLGGQGVQFLWQRVLQDCPALDSVCLYEGEQTVGELWHALRERKSFGTIKGLAHRRGGTVIAEPRPPVTDLDALPFPHREPGPYPSGLATVSTSRGCMAHCTFCQSGNYGNRYHRLPKWRARSAANIAAELTNLIREHQITAVSFVDDDFFGGDGQGNERAYELARLLHTLPGGIHFSIECRINELDEPLFQALRAAGLRRVLIGIEAANEADLALFAKKTTNAQAARAISSLRSLDIDFSLGFIMFQPLSSLDAIGENLTFLHRHRVAAHRQLVNRLELYPAAPLTRYFQRKGVELREEGYRIEYEFSDPAVTLLRRAFMEVLKPYIRVERACQAALFQAVTHGQGESSRRLREHAADICEALSSHALKCWERVAADSDPGQDPALKSEVSEEVRRLTATIS